MHRVCVHGTACRPLESPALPLIQPWVMGTCAMPSTAMTWHTAAAFTCSSSASVAMTKCAGKSAALQSIICALRWQQASEGASGSAIAVECVCRCRRPRATRSVVAWVTSGCFSCETRRCAVQLRRRCAGAVLVVPTAMVTLTLTWTHDTLRESFPGAERTWDLVSSSWTMFSARLCWFSSLDSVVRHRAFSSPSTFEQKSARIHGKVNKYHDEPVCCPKTADVARCSMNRSKTRTMNLGTSEPPTIKRTHGDLREAEQQINTSNVCLCLLERYKLSAP